jgi:hypothetical protein
MNNLGTYLRRQAKKLLDTSIHQLKAGIINRLSSKYTPLYGEEKAVHLSKAVLNRCLLVEPGAMDDKIFYQNHIDLIEYELLRLAEDESIAKGLSYLYTAETLYSTPLTKKYASKYAQELSEQAARLSIHIPNKNEICGSTDMNECVIEIMKFAAVYYNDSYLDNQV